jgi:hypothetical protein
VDEQLQTYKGKLHILNTKRAGRLLEIDLTAEKHSAFALNFT